MIDKLTPKFLDKSSDYKLVRKTSLIDALNIYVDVETGGEGTGGVIKPIKGNLGIATSSFDEQFSEDVNYKAIGSVTDEVTGIVYFFVWSEDSSEHGVWAYDHRGVLPQYNGESFVPGEKKRVRKIISASEFNFPVNGFVKGDIVYSNTREFEKYDQLRDLPYPEKDAILYFTDNVNEPRRINVYRALLSGYPALGTQARKDFISACPRVPLDRPSFRFIADQDRDVNNFATSPGFQFAYQNIYQDGMESSISPYSSVAFPPSIVNRGAISSNQILAHNKCIITIPPQNEEVQSIKILARYGNGVNFIEIDEVDNTPGQETVFDFYNDRISSGVSPQTTDKTFDNVPQKAQAQSVASNRLVYGNYVEGYDNVDCSGVNLAPLYTDRPSEIIDYVLEIESSIERCSGGSVDNSSGQEKTPNKTLGFTYDTSQFADSIPRNTKIIVSFSFTPDQNFHFYNVGDVPHSSYHQSKHIGKYSLDLPGYKSAVLDPDADAVNPDSPAYFQENDGYGEPGYLDDASAGGYFLQENRENYFGFTKGLSDNTANPSPVKWNQVIATAQLGMSVNPLREIAFGTSAGNPLIIQGGKLHFALEFTVVNAVSSGGQGFIADVVQYLLEGRDQAYIDQQLGAGNVIFDPANIKRTHVHSFNLGLSDYNSFSVDHEYASLICGAANVPPDGPLSHSTLSETLKDKPPSCAFMVNKAEVGFYLQKSTTRTGGQHRGFIIGVGYINVEDESDVWTCVRDIDPSSPWWVISKDKLNGDFASNPTQEWENNLQVPGRIFRRMSGASQTPHIGFTRNFAMNFDGAHGGSNSSDSRQVMEMCFGHITVSPDINGNLNLLPFYHDIDQPTGDSADPIMPISMQDGEGGPGGKAASDSGDAYSVLRCGDLGSIAGQAFVGVDNNAIEKGKHKGYQLYVSSEEGDAQGSNSTLNGNQFSYVVDTSVATDLDLPLYEQQGFQNLGLYIHDSIFMGPYYTGRIVLNNIQVEGNYGNVNITPLPYAGTGERHLPMTTTLPLVMFSSWTKFPADAGNESQGALIKADPELYDTAFELGDGQDNYQVSYANPITVPGGFVDGELASGTLEEDPFGTGYQCVSFERQHSHAEQNPVAVTSYEPAGEKAPSFKTSATHELGMVYYDERGRHGRVNPIGSVYVSGYGERNSLPKGRALIRASNITHTPPSWAKKYKFVYSKNTSIDKFIQYSAGGAFAASSEYEGANPTSIYVSLNYLQGHPVSYSDAFGARGRDNTPVMYSFTPGDRLRVISHMTSLEDASISTVYPVGMDFEVTGVVNLTDQVDSHPFPLIEDESVSVPESRQGLFLVLKNNTNASGFKYESVRDGSDNWGNNCIFEIYSSVKEVDREDRLYYEIGEAYDVVYATHPDGGEPQYYHDVESVILEEGDVYFRRHAVNLREFVGSSFIDLLDATDEDGNAIPSESNFKSFYLESEAATDLFPARAISIGRPNIIDLDARQSRRESSVIHSDKDIVESRKLGYSSFNRTIPSDMEIDTKAGAINYLTNHQDSLFFVQKNKCGHIPVDRTLISDTTGTASLIASSKFLGTPRYYVGEVGCDDNPESVVSINNAAYFANKSTGKVFKVSGANGVNVISDKGVSEYLRNQFNAATFNASNGVRVVGGYDPLKKEYLLTIIRNEFASSYGSFEEDELIENWVPVNQGNDGEIYYGDEDVDDVGDEGPVEEAVEPKIRVDWNKASNLDNASWSLYYDSDIDDESGNLNTANSLWRPRPGGNLYPMSIDAEIEVKFVNAGAFDTVPEVVLDLGNGLDTGFIAGINAKTWDLSDVDNDNIATTRQVLGELGLLETNGSVWHFNNTITDPDIQMNDVDGPYSVTVRLENPDQYGEEETVIKKVGVRFICPVSDVAEDWYNIINPFDLANIVSASGTFNGSLRVTSSTPFTKGTDENSQTNEAYTSLTGNVFVNAASVFEGVFVDIDLTNVAAASSGGIDLDDVIPFNPCAPTFGIWDLTDENGELPADVDWSSAGPMVTSNVVSDYRIRTWIDGIYGEGTWSAAILSYSFGTLFIKQEVDRQIQELFGPGTGGVACPNINYDAIDAEDDETTGAA